MHSFDASTMNFGEVVQHTSPLNKRYWHFLIPLSEPASETRRCWKMESCSQGAHSCEHEFLGTLYNNKPGSPALPGGGGGSHCTTLFAYDFNLGLV